VYDIFPEKLLDREQKEAVLAYLASLDAPPDRRKQALIWWCRFFFVRLTSDMVVQVLGGEEMKRR